MTLNPSLQILLQQGHDKLDKGNYLAALQNFQQAAALEPQNPQVLYGLGLACYRLEQYQDAVEYLNQALEIKPNYILALAWRGLAYQQMQQPQEAQADFEQAIAFEPQDADDWSGRGIALDELQRHEEAMSAFDKAIEINPDDYFAWNHRGLTLDNLERHEQALASYDKTLEIKPDYYFAWDNRGIALEKLERYEQAITSFDKVIEIKPDYYWAWNSRGSALGNLGRYNEALAAFDKAIEIQPGNYSAWFNRGRVLPDLERYEEAIASYDKAIAIQANRDYIWNNRGIVLCDFLKRYEEALTSFDIAIAIKPDNDSAWYNRGVALSNLARYEEAITAYNKAIELKPEYYAAWHNQGVALSNLAQYEEAITSFDKVIEFKPDEHRAWYHRGIAFLQLGQYEKAIASFDKAIEFKPEAHEAWHNRGSALGNLERHQEALSSFDKAIEIKRDEHEAWSNRGLALSNLRRFEEAIASYDEALRLTDYQFWQAWDNRGYTVLKSQGYKAAVKNWDDGIKALQPQTPEYDEGCGELHFRKGKTLYDYGKEQANPFPDWFEAKTTYEKALDFLTFEKFPQRHLQILEEFLKVCSSLGDTQTFEKRREEGTQQLEKLLRDCEFTGQKIALARKFAAFAQLRINIHLQSNHVEKEIVALELAEERKNTCLMWLRERWDYQLPRLNYQDMQKLLNPQTAAIYWHISPVAITTFIIKYKNPKPITLPPQSSSQTSLVKSAKFSFIPSLRKSPVKETSTALAHIHQIQSFEAWMQEWKQAYQDYCQGNYAGTAKETAPWRQKMEYMLLNQLHEILEINRLRDYLNNVDHLILIPHRELHLLPLDYLFPGRLTVTYLPSFQIGLKLVAQASPVALRDSPTNIVNVASSDLPFNNIESVALSSLYPECRHLQIPPVTQQALIAALRENTGYFHFTGHGNHIPEQPRDSFLMLAETDKLTLGDIFDDEELDLSQFELICLSACETGITSQESLVDEYVGLVSGFLAKGANYVVSTLWRVDERSTALLMIRFYQLLKLRETPAAALKQAKDWLRQLTYEALAKWYRELAKQLHEPHCRAYLETEAQIIEDDSNKMASSEPPYAHPYYWAGFILTGKPA